MTLYLVLWITCLCLFVALMIYNLAKFKDGIVGTVNEVHCAMQIKLITLLLLLGVKSYLNWYFVRLCPWELEHAKLIYLIEQLTTFI